MPALQNGARSDNAGNDGGCDSLAAYFLNNTGRKINKWHHYLPIYEKHFEPVRNDVREVLEIGIGEGGSLQMWKAYFPKARITGLDNDGKTQFKENRITTVLGDQRDCALLGTLGNFDIIIDDGKHRFPHQKASFEALYHRASRFYVVEDLHTAYWKQYEGGLGANQFVEYAKKHVDKLNAWHCDALAPDAFTLSTVGIHFYGSMVIYEKGQVNPPKSEIR